MSTQRRPTARVGAGIAVAILLVLGPLVASRHAVADPKAELEAARSRLRALEARIASAVAQREALRSRLVELFEGIDAAVSEIERVHDGMAATRLRIEGLSLEIRTRQATLDRRAATAFMAGPIQVDVLLGADTFGHFQDALQFLTATTQSDLDIAAGLGNRKAEAALRLAQLARLETRLTGVRARLQEAATSLSQRLAEQQAIIHRLARDRAEASVLVRRLDRERQRLAATPPPPPEQKPPPAKRVRPMDPEEVRTLIVTEFEPLGPAQVAIALCVARSESGFNHLAENPVTGAAGVFQFLPSTWASIAEAAGRGRSSVFDGEANVFVAAWAVANYGWSPWSTTASRCQAEAA